MIAQSNYEAVDRYGKELGAMRAPHDVRCTFAKLAHQGRAPFERIRQTNYIFPVGPSI
jgi:hypothetical protein